MLVDSSALRLRGLAYVGVRGKDVQMAAGQSTPHGALL